MQYFYCDVGGGYALWRGLDEGVHILPDSSPQWLFWLLLQIAVIRACEIRSQSCFVDLRNGSNTERCLVELLEDLIEMSSAKCRGDGSLRMFERVSRRIRVQLGHDLAHLRREDVAPRCCPLAQFDESRSCPFHCIDQESVPPHCASPVIVFIFFSLSYPDDWNCDNDRHEDDEEVEESKGRRDRLVDILVEDIYNSPVKALQAVDVVWYFLADLFSGHLQHSTLRSLGLIVILFFAKLDESSRRQSSSGKE